ncbi:IS3 family transposase [Paenibacillus antibioticophila]|uniref:IS3 family transposase n=1 Tax=Paenibacillus antibioticophila TaxID=1274374 RepID=UPI001BB3DEC8
MDELYTGIQSRGYRTLTKVICRDHKLEVNFKRVLQLMQKMGVYTTYPKRI